MFCFIDVIPDCERTSSAVGEQLLQIRSLDSSGQEGWQDISGQTSCMKQAQFKVRPGCSGLFPVRTLPHLNLPDFSVVKSIASIVYHPVPPEGCHSVHLNTSCSPGWASPTRSASHHSMCSGLSLPQWQFNKLAPHLPCIWVRSEAGTQSNFRGTCIYSYFVHWSCRLMYGICLTSSKILRRSPIGPPNWSNPAKRGKHRSPKKKLLSVNPQTESWSGLEERFLPKIYAWVVLLPVSHRGCFTCPRAREEEVILRKVIVSLPGSDKASSGAGDL